MKPVTTSPTTGPAHDVKKGAEYAILTNLIHQEWSGVSVKAHKDLKGLETQNLLDHMSEAELSFTALAELSTRRIAETTTATGLTENKSAAKIGGNIEKGARLELEAKTSKPVVTGDNNLPPGKRKTSRVTSRGEPAVALWSTRWKK